MEKLVSLYNNKIDLKDKEIEALKEQIRISKEKLNYLKKENESIKENNYNYKMSHINDIESCLNKKEIKNKSNKKYSGYNNREKYINTIEEDNINNIKNDLLIKIGIFYNNIYKIKNNTNDNIIEKYNDLDDINYLIELQKKFNFIENNINNS